MGAETLRLSEFCALIGEARETLRSTVARGEAPWPVDFNGEKQRRYTGADLFAWRVFKCLRQMGIGASIAAEAVIVSDVVHAAEQDLKQGKPLAGQFLVVALEAKEDSTGEKKTVFWQQLMDQDELSNFLIHQEETLGETTLTNQKKLGMVGLTIVPIAACYAWCVEVAGENELSLDGLSFQDK